LRLRAVDPETPGTVALLHGPVALFAVGSLPTTFSKKQLLTALAASATSEDWMVEGDAGKVTFRPFGAIRDEEYRLYQVVKT
jgi:uncharacterized protein